MSISERFSMLLLGVMVLGITFSSASSRPWNPTPSQIAGDYAQITHAKSSTDFVNIRWWDFFAKVSRKIWKHSVSGAGRIRKMQVPSFGLTAPYKWTYSRMSWQATSGRIPMGAQHGRGRFIRPNRASSPNMMRKRRPRLAAARRAFFTALGKPFF
jgi:hypothetical protein